MQLDRVMSQMEDDIDQKGYDINVNKYIDAISDSFDIDIAVKRVRNILPKHIDYSEHEKHFAWNLNWNRNKIE